MSTNPNPVRKTDEELFQLLGIADEPNRAAILARIPPEKLAVYERLDEVAHELNLWTAGLGPKPEGVIVCHEHKGRRRP